MILLHRTCQYSHLDTLNSKIHPLFQILDTDPGWCNNSGGGGAGAGGAGVGGAGEGGEVQCYCRI